MEVLKFILKNYGPVICSVVLMVYVCFFTKKEMNGNEQKLKQDISTLIRENAELKVQIKKSQELLNKGVDKLNEKVNDLEEQLDLIVKESEENEPNNE